MISNLSNSSLLSKPYYKSMLAGNEAYMPGSMDLISTTILSTTNASITLDVSGLASAYKHLQIRSVAKTNDNANDINGVWIKFRFNADSNANYSRHGLDYVTDYGNGSSRSLNTTSTTGMNIGISSSVQFSPNVHDIIDAFSTSKNKTIKGLSGQHSGGEYSYVGFYGGAWLSTAAITSINISSDSGSSFIAGSRFSIYGIKG